MKLESGVSRRDLIKRFGVLAFAMSPVLRAMGYNIGGPFAGAPRFVHFFKGGSFHPASTNPPSISQLAGTPIAPLQPHAQDIILFKNMSIHGGSPKSDGYQEEHGAGLLGCATGNSYRYSRNDSYFAYTDHESIDVAIANAYRARPALAGLPLASLHLGAGAHSDADSVGLGQRYISFRKRQAGDSQYGNAIEPIQDTGQVFDTLMQRISLVCQRMSNQPGAEQNQLRAALLRKKSLLDFRIADINDAKRALGAGSVHAQKFDGLLEGWREQEGLNNAQLGALDGGSSMPSGGACPTMTRPTGNGANQSNLDRISAVHDQMISLIKLAFEWDVTRVVAFTLSGASSGQSLPSRGVSQAHHSIEHSNNVSALNIMGTYYAEKFAGLVAALKSIDDGQGQTGLTNSAVLLGMECWSNSSSGHFLTNIPFVVAGQAGGAFQTGRIINAAGRNNNDMLVSIQKACGINSDVFGLQSLCRGPII
jgi:hypothetical protein